MEEMPFPLQSIQSQNVKYILQPPKLKGKMKNINVLSGLDSTTPKLHVEGCSSRSGVTKWNHSPAKGVVVLKAK